MSISDAAALSTEITINHEPPSRTVAGQHKPTGPTTTDERRRETRGAGAVPRHWKATGRGRWPAPTARTDGSDGLAQGAARAGGSSGRTNHGALSIALRLILLRCCRIYRNGCPLTAGGCDWRRRLGIRHKPFRPERRTLWPFSHWTIVASPTDPFPRRYDGHL